MRGLLAVLLSGIIFAGCGSSQHLTAFPAGLDPESVPRETIDIFATNYQFTPDVIHVKAGTLVTLKLTTDEGPHGFSLHDYDIDEIIESGQIRRIDVYFALKGEFEFSCSHFCGLGHFGMNGKIIVE